MAYLGPTTDAGSAHLQQALFAKLHDCGYVEGKNLLVERRFAEGKYDRLEALAAELVAFKPDVLFVSGTQGAVAASRVTRKIPVVFVTVSYPVAMGLVRSLAYPGTNMTGIVNPSDVLSRARLHLLKELVPKAKKVAVLHNAKNAVESLMLAAIREANEKLRMSLPQLVVTSEQDLSMTFDTLSGMRPDALYVMESPLNFMHRARIIESVSEEYLPAVYGYSEFAEAGGLMSYSTNLVEQFAVAATFIDRIFRGAKPAELPVAQPAKFELVINLKTAKALDITIPPSVLQRADRLIE
jgi:putative ABC transport system substrate-binding protein